MIFRLIQKQNFFYEQKPENINLKSCGNTRKRRYDAREVGIREVDCTLFSTKSYYAALKKGKSAGGKNCMAGSQKIFSFPRRKKMKRKHKGGKQNKRIEVRIKDQKTKENEIFQIDQHTCTLVATDIIRLGQDAIIISLLHNKGFQGKAIIVQHLT